MYINHITMAGKYSRREYGVDKDYFHNYKSKIYISPWKLQKKAEQSYLVEY